MSSPTDTHASIPYVSCSDLLVITSFFNPGRYKSKRENYTLFAESLHQSNIRLLTVECTLDDDQPELSDFDNVIQVKTKSVLWHKERLLNIAINNIPRDVTKIAWLDCDILFTNPCWAVETSKLLDIFPIVQPYQELIRLPKGQICYRGHGNRWKSFGYVLQEISNDVSKGSFNLHGHTGMAWAARTELLKAHGLYDGCIGGGGDHVMAHAMAGSLDDACIGRILGPITQENNHLKHFLKWADPFYSDVRGNLGYVSGLVLHLWHGESQNRQYVERHERLQVIGFDPFTDLEVNESGVWEWKSGRFDLHRWAREYFEQRQEDN